MINHVKNDQTRGQSCAFVFRHQLHCSVVIPASVKSQWTRNERTQSNYCTQHREIMEITIPSSVITVTDSNLNHRTLLVVVQIMDLEFGNESDTYLAENLFQQDKEDGPGGSEVMTETSTDSKMQGEIQEFYV